MSNAEPSAALLAIGAKLFPRRYQRFKDLRPRYAACEWARTLDWRQNPYDRFLLRRELLNHLESMESCNGQRNIYTFASREEIAAEVDRLTAEFTDKFEAMGVFNYVMFSAPWHLAFMHGRICQSRLSQALATLPSKMAGR